nr:hypothetical protein L204_02158 [Cryptococcus depauperatus CBS 7855]
MKLSVITALVAFASVAFAKVNQVSVPSKAIPGESITAQVSSTSYIQNWDDFGIIWGLVQQGHECEGCVGREIGYQNLYNEPSYPNQPGNYSFQVTIPQVDTGSYIFVAAVPHLVGASGTTGFNYFNQPIELVLNAKTRV